MKYSDNINRRLLDIVYVIRTRNEMEAREEYDSLLWSIEREGFLPYNRSLNLYSIPARDVKIGESVYDYNVKKVAYRSE